jgi:Cys-rich repeat protein
MDGSRFDEFTKVLAQPTSRRQALKAIVATTLGGILGLGRLGTAFGAPKCHRAGLGCDTDSNCCAEVCCNGMCCASGQVCQNGTCVTCTANGGTCSGSSDCCSSNCSNGFCCASGQVGLSNGSCATPCTGPISLGCQPDVSGAQYCSGGGCTGTGCRTDSDCPAGQFCDSLCGAPSEGDAGACMPLC